MLRLKSSEKSSSGCECDYYALGKGFGLKVYGSAKRAQDTRDMQDYMSMYGLAPNVRGRVQVIEHYRYCYDRLTRRRREGWWDGYAYVTESVRPADDFDLTDKMRDDGRKLKSWVCAVLEKDTDYGLDFHTGNWGYKNGEPLFLDVGCFTHVSDWRIKYEQKQEERGTVPEEAMDKWIEYNRECLRQDAGLPRWVLGELQRSTARSDLQTGGDEPVIVSRSRRSEGAGQPQQYRAGVTCPADCYAGPCCTVCDERA
jgi:hypothetical protein